MVDNVQAVTYKRSLLSHANPLETSSSRERKQEPLRLCAEVRTEGGKLGEADATRAARKEARCRYGQRASTTPGQAMACSLRRAAWPWRE